MNTYIIILIFQNLVLYRAIFGGVVFKKKVSYAPHTPGYLQTKLYSSMSFWQLFLLFQGKFQWESLVLCVFHAYWCVCVCVLTWDSKQKKEKSLSHLLFYFLRPCMTRTAGWSRNVSVQPMSAMCWQGLRCLTCRLAVPRIYLLWWQVEFGVTAGIKPRYSDMGLRQLNDFITARLLFILFFPYDASHMSTLLGSSFFILEFGLLKCILLTRTAFFFSKMLRQRTQTKLTYSKVHTFDHASPQIVTYVYVIGWIVFLKKICNHCNHWALPGNRILISNRVIAEKWWVSVRLY